MLNSLFVDEIKQKVIDTLNDELNTPVAVEGPVRLNLWSHFPHLSIELNRLNALESIESSNEVLLTADKVYLMLNLQKLWHREWEIDHLAIENGVLNMYKDKTGQINYNFISEKEEKHEDQQKSISLKIASADLKNIAFSFLDDKSNIDVNLQIHQLNLSGDFSADSIALKLRSNFLAQQIDIKDTRYIDQQDIRLNGAFTLFPSSEKYAFHQMELSIGENPFLLNGDIDQRKYSTLYNLQISGQDLQINDFLKILPQRFAEWAPRIEATGKFFFETKIRGYLNAQNNPYVEINYELDDAVVIAKQEKINIEDLSSKGSFNNGESHTLEDAALSLDHLKFRNEGRELTTQLFYKNFNSPYIILKLNGSIESTQLAMLDSLLPVKNLIGVMDFEKFDLRGRFINTAQQNNIALKGKVSTSGLMFDLQSRPVLINDLSIDFREDKIDLQELDLVLADQKIEFTGSLNTIDKWLKSSPEYSLDGKLVAAKFDLLAIENWWKLGVESPETKTEKTSTIDGNIDFEIEKLSYKELILENVRSGLAMKPDGRQQFKLHFNSMEGTGQFVGQNDVNCDQCLSIKYRLDSIDIKSLFTQLDNFGQNELTSKNLEGKLTSSGELNFSNLEALDDFDNMRGKIYMNIKDGALLNFKPMESLSSFIKLDDLRDIRFRTLENELSIEEGKIEIPEMIILSNAFTLALSGQQYFDSRINYLIKLNIYNVLGNKFRFRKSEMPDVEMIDKDDFNFYLKMQGTTENPIVSFDKQGVKNRFKQQKKDWEELRNPESRDYSIRDEKEQWNTEEELEEIEWDN